MTTSWVTFQFTNESNPQITYFDGYIQFNSTPIDPPPDYTSTNTTYYQIVKIVSKTDLVTNILLSTESIQSIVNNNPTAFASRIPNNVIAYNSPYHYYNFTYNGIVVTSLPNIAPDTSNYYFILNGPSGGPNSGISSRIMNIRYSDTSGNIVTPTTPPPQSEYFDLFTNTIDPSCFNQGTKILSLNKKLEEEYIAIENLRKGDLVKSYKHGFRKIYLIGKNVMINNPEHFNLSMYKMKKTEENGLIEDLIVTGGHGILVDDLGELEEKTKELFKGTIPIIDDKKLLLAGVSKDFIQLKENDLYTYYQLTLENEGDDDKRFGIWANGLLTETPSKKQFLEKKYIDL